MFKNLQLYRLPAPWDMTADRLGAQMERKKFQPCGAMDMRSNGWMSPCNDGSFVHAAENHWLLTLCTEQKILPGSVINQAVKKKAAEVEKQQGRRPGRKEMKEIKERVIEELLPRAFSARKTIMIWIDPKNGWLAIDTSSPKKAEEVLDALRKTLDDLPLSLARTNIAPATAMASWLVGEAPDGFSVDRDCELRASDEEKATVRYARHTLDAKDVREHISEGKLPAHLAMTWNDRLSFVLTDTLQVKRLAFLDVVLEDAEEAETAEEQFNANFAIMTGELSSLLPDLVEALGGEVQE